MTRKFQVTISITAAIIMLCTLIIPAVNAGTHNSCSAMETQIHAATVLSSMNHPSGCIHNHPGSPEKVGSCSRCNGSGKCQVCGGTGKINDHECSICNGSGKCHYCDGDGELWD